MRNYSEAQIAAVSKASRNIADTIIHAGNEWRSQIVEEYKLTDKLVDIVLGRAFLIAAASVFSEAYNLDAVQIGARLNHVIAHMANESRKP